MPTLWLQGNSQEMFEAEGRQRRLGLRRLHEGHRRQRPDRLARFTSKTLLTSSEESEEKQAVQTPPDAPSTHQLQEVHSSGKEDFVCVRSGQQGALSPPSLLSFGDLSRFFGIQVVYLASSLRPALDSASWSSADILRDLVHQLRPLSVQVEVSGVQALAAGVELVRRSDFDPAHTLNVR